MGAKIRATRKRRVITDEAASTDGSNTEHIGSIQPAGAVDLEGQAPRPAPVPVAVTESLCARVLDGLLLRPPALFVHIFFKSSGSSVALGRASVSACFSASACAKRQCLWQCPSPS